MNNDNLEYYRDAYEIGPEKIIDTYAAATQHVDQGLSLTLFFSDEASTRDINRAQIYARRKGIKPSITCACASPRWKAPKWRAVFPAPYKPFISGYYHDHIKPHFRD